jgi:ankyrin repeat protein
MPDLFCAAGLGLTDVVKLFWNPDGSLKAHSSQTGSSRYDESGKRLPLGQSEAEMLGDALYIACRNGRLEASRWLLDHGADPNWLGYIGGSCLHWAEFSQNTELCALLRERGAREDLLDAQFKATPRQFPVMVLAGWGFTDALERYLTAHPDAVKTQTEAGTPLDVATANGHARAVTILRSHGA